MKKIVLSLICLISLGIQGFSQANIAEARAMGVGAVVTVRGIVTNGSELGKDIRYFQDATAGIAAYKYNAFPDILRGDSIVVSGTLKLYNQLLEIDPMTSFEKLGSDKPLPEPIIITPGQMSEPYEAELVKMENVTFANGGAVFAGNSNYNITGNGQTAQVRVNVASNLVGRIIPTDEVTIVGICSQFHFTDPLAGYQLLLRDTLDIVTKSAILFTEPLTVSNISTTGFWLAWATNIAGTTELFYGLTPQLELGHSVVAGSGLTHSINLAGLNPSDLVYIQAFSVAGSDTGWSGLKNFITQSVSSGNIKTYFTRPVDTTVSTGTKAIFLYRSIDDTCIAYINRAKYSIDVAIYNFNVEGIANIAGALNAAYARGVVVRVVTDGKTNNSGIPELNAGIGKIARPASTTGIMHNKFMVIDGKSSNTNDPIVWTGSCNWTDQNVNTDANNVLFIQDASLAKVFILEFEEMFGSSTAQPDAAKAKFGSDKADNTPHELIIGGKRVEVFFSPSDGVNQQIVNHIATANSDIEIGTMLMTRLIISDAIIERFVAGVSSKVIISNRATSPQVIDALGIALGNNFKEYHEQGMLHSKSMIIDQSNPSSDPFVWTGSHNWSDAANTVNDENTLVIHDATIANLFHQEFTERFKLAIPISERPILNLGPDQIVPAGQTVTLDAGQFITYNWSTGDLTQIITVDSTDVGYGTKKVYCRVTDAYGLQSDTVLITFTPAIGINEQNTLISKLSVYPNPSTGAFTVGFTAKRSETIGIELMSFAGRVVWQSVATTLKGSNSIKVQDVNVPSGIYLVRLKTSEGDLGKKLMIK
ncbi:MAG: phospholipase D-like domain-containing protein [Bacteroidota bacterium]